MSKSTTSTQKNSPPSWAKPLFEKSANDALGLYNSGTGFQPYGGQRTADMNGQTMTGIHGIGSLSGPGMGGLSNTNIDGTGKLERMARGGFMGANPYIKNALQQSTDQVKSLFSGSGRYGSGVNQAVVGQNANDILSRNYQFERGQMMDAGNILAQRNNSDFSNRMQQAGAQMGAGNMLQALRQKQLDDKRALFNETQNVDWTRLGALQAAAQGAAGAYGTQVGTQKQPFNPLALIGALGAFA